MTVGSCYNSQLRPVQAVGTRPLLEAYLAKGNRRTWSCAYSLVESTEEIKGVQTAQTDATEGLGLCRQPSRGYRMTGAVKTSQFRSQEEKELYREPRGTQQKDVLL